MVLSLKKGDLSLALFGFRHRIFFYDSFMMKCMHSKHPYTPMDRVFYIVRVQYDQPLPVYTPIGRFSVHGDLRR